MQDTQSDKDSLSNNAPEGIEDLGEIIIYRDHKTEDAGFIYSTWLQGLYYGNDWFKQIDQETYFDFYNKIIRQLLFKKSAKIKVAALKEDPDVLIGYSVWRESTLDWVFVKPAWRRLGIAKRLIPENIAKCTHMTKIGKSLKPKEWEFDPFS